MPTVYYLDGSSQKYKYYNQIFYEDPYLEKTEYYYYVDEDIHPYQLAVSGSNHIEIMKNMLPPIDIDLLENNIIKTKTININGIFHFANIKYGYCQMVYPLIDEDILKKIMNEYKFVKKFYLSNHLIKDELLDFTLFRDLEKIKLSRNLLTEIPQSIFKLTKLKKLVIKGLSKEFPNTRKKIDTCDIERFGDPENCNIHRIPKEIKNLQSLLKLNLENQKLTFLPPEFKELKNLKELYLSDNYFSELPIQIYHLENLKILEMNRIIMTISNDIINLKNLEILKLQGTWYDCDKYTSAIGGVDFENLPENFFLDTKLKELYIDNFTELSYNTIKMKRNLIINSFDGHNNIIKLLYDENTKIINYNKYSEDERKTEFEKIYKLIDDDLYIKNMKHFVKIDPY